MVDFNNETTITRPAVDIERVLVLQRRHDCIEAYEGYQKAILSGADTGDYTFRSRVLSLFIELKASLKRHYPEGDKDKISFVELETWIRKGEEDELFNAFDLINDFLDVIKLTRLDTHKVYDSTRVEVENREKKL